MSTYDVEDESILSTVFKDAFPDSWRGNTEFAQYLSELSSFGVEKLNREPERLAEERAQILEQTQDLAFHNYKTFIQTAECSKEIFQDFQVIEKHVNSLLSKLPKLNTECSVFLKQAQDINTSRRMNSMTLQRHTQLLEILEMPQLMDTCVRNGYCEEALELAAHVKRLERKHAGLPVIQNIVSEVKNSTQLMLTQLIQQLRSNLQLPACLRVIGYLRRMDVFTEAELRIKFLQARDSWFMGILANIPGDDPYYHITKTIETSRVHLFDIITQYRAIFSDEDPILSPTKDDTNSEAAIFHGWVIQKVSQFLATLEMDLKKGITTRLDSLLGQCMYFGLSFSRVGADFRGLLAPIFQRAALQVFVSTLNEGNSRLDESMESYTLLGTLSSVPSSALSFAAQTGGTLHPPSVLLEFSPLAVYCNSVLTAFNDLRLCAPLSMACDVSDHVQMSLTKAAECVLAYHRAEEATFNPQEHDKFTSLCRVFAEELVPFLNKCLQLLFPPASLATMLGVHLSDMVKLGFIGVMDIEAIILPIEHLLPAKVEPILPEPEIDDLIGRNQSEADQSEGEKVEGDESEQKEEDKKEEKEEEKSENKNENTQNDESGENQDERTENVDENIPPAEENSPSTDEIESESQAQTESEQSKTEDENKEEIKTEGENNKEIKTEDENNKDINTEDEIITQGESENLPQEEENKENSEEVTPPEVTEQTQE